MSAHPTLLVFTLGPEREQARRHLLPESLKGLERSLHERCLHSALEAGRECGWQLAISSPSRVEEAADVAHLGQSGRSFGGRFRRAFRETLEETRGPVVAVGSDSPGLRSSHLHEAIDALAEDPDRVVIGPSPDGGFYLIAAARPLDGELADVQWQSRRTLQTLLDRLANAGRDVVLLDPLVDLDEPRDLARWVAVGSRVEASIENSAWAELLAAIRTAFAALCAPIPARGARFAQLRFAAASFGRAPPA